MNMIKQSHLIATLLAAMMLALSGAAQAAIVGMDAQVKRSDNTTVNAGERHEFRGGSHVFFKGIDERSGWLEKNLMSNTETFKTGWTRVFLGWPQRVSRIVLHRASVGKKPFKGGWIVLEVQTPRGKWIKLFERKNDDVDRPVTIRKGLPMMIKGVRVRFHASHPITIGPIEVRG